MAVLTVSEINDGGLPRKQPRLFVTYGTSGDASLDAVPTPVCQVRASHVLPNNHQEPCVLRRNISGISTTLKRPYTMQTAGGPSWTRYKVCPRIQNPAFTNNPGPSQNGAFALMRMPGYILANFITLPYYRFYRQNTLLPILAIARSLKEKDDPKHVSERLVHWRGRKLHELEFTQVAVRVP